MEDYLKRLGYSIARGVPQAFTGFVDLAALPFTMSGMIKPEDVFFSTDYLTQKGFLPKPEQGLLNQTTELLSSAISPAAATKGAILATGGLLADAARVSGADLTPVGAIKIPKGLMAEEPGITAYHGSPYDFDKFQLDKIGTGEGAQAYGYGLYFTDTEDIAKHYKNMTSRSVDIDGKPFIRGEKVFKEALGDDEILDDLLASRGDVDKAIEGVEASIDVMRAFNPAEIPYYESQIERLKNIKDRVTVNETGGKTYEVALTPKVSELLDYDEPLKDQPEKIQKAFKQIWWNTHVKGNDILEELYESADDVRLVEELQLFPESRGSQSYRTLASKVGGEKKLSQLLAEQGVKGIKFLDNASRGRPYLITLKTSKGKTYETEPIFASSKQEADQIAQEYKDKGFGTEIKKIGKNNYVIFDDKDINITRKYELGGAGLAGLLGYQLLDDEDEISLGQIRI